jgi:hypothetical protein
MASGIKSEGLGVCLRIAGLKWRKRVGVEPTGDGVTRRPPVLKTGTITGPHALPEEIATATWVAARSSDRVWVTSIPRDISVVLPRSRPKAG